VIALTGQPNTAVPLDSLGKVFKASTARTVL
jgi:hypothetical protein